MMNVGTASASQFGHGVKHYRKQIEKGNPLVLTLNNVPVMMVLKYDEELLKKVIGT
jgi:hypothetical protein